jgi:hypothetical protein
MPRTNQLVLAPKSPLLITESAEEFDVLRGAFEREIKPRGIIEHMYVYDIACIVWEILRLRRGKAAIINAAFRDALVNVLIECLATSGKMNLRAEANSLAGAWFKDKEGKKRVAEILNERGFDEYVIEGETFRKSSSTLEQLDRMLASLERRRNRALQCIGEYRYGLAKQLRESSDRVIEGEKVPELEHGASEDGVEAAPSEQPVEVAFGEKPAEPLSSEGPTEPQSSKQRVESASREEPLGAASREELVAPGSSGERAAA